MNAFPTAFLTAPMALSIDRNALDALRFKLLKRQLIRACQDVSFYHEAFARRGLDPRRLKDLREFADYPTIRKEDIQKNTRAFVSRRISLEKAPKSHSSGSTGRPLWTYFDRRAWLRKKYLVKLRARFACGLKRGQRVAVFTTDPPRDIAKRNRNRLLSTPLLKVRYFSIFDSPQQNLEDLFQFRPQNIDSTPSHLFQLSMLLQREKRCPAFIERVFTSSEYLAPSVRQAIQGAFNAPVFDIYGCTELKEVAWECARHDGYHINEDEVLVEILHDGQPAANGTPGEIVLTDLRNSAMPLIRYRIGDYGVAHEGPCACGVVFARMSPSAGRFSDYLVMPDGEKISPYRFTTAVEKTRGLLQYQFLQEGLDLIVVKVVLDQAASRDVAAKIQERLRPILGGEVRIRVEACERIDIEENGKFKVVKSALPHGLP